MNTNKPATKEDANRVRPQFFVYEDEGQTQILLTDFIANISVGTPAGPAVVLIQSASGGGVMIQHPDLDVGQANLLAKIVSEAIAVPKLKRGLPMNLNKLLTYVMTKSSSVIVPVQ